MTTNTFFRKRCKHLSWHVMLDINVKCSREVALFQLDVPMPLTHGLPCSPPFSKFGRERRGAAVRQGRFLRVQPGSPSSPHGCEV